MVMKQIILLSFVLIAFALTSCGAAKDCDCPSFSQVAESQSTQG